MKKKFRISIITSILLLLLLYIYNNVPSLKRNVIRMSNSSFISDLYRSDAGKSNRCHSLQKSIDEILANNIDLWSLSVHDANGFVIADVNSTTSRIPASNQKIITSAYALSTLGDDYLLNTKLYVDKNGSFYLFGSGDPDLHTSSLFQLVDEAINNHLESTSSPEVYIFIMEEPSSLWRSPGWLVEDHFEAYGAPITRLALNSNANEIAIQDPLSAISTLIEGRIRKSGLIPILSTLRHNNNIIYDNQLQLIKEQSSARMSALLSLSNSESHNFTAEVLLRHASGSWDPVIASANVISWLESIDINTMSFTISDGSGLSRNNRVTTRSLAKLLALIDKSNNGVYFRSTMAIAGIRGTLRSLYKDQQLSGRFWGKTGTLEGVRSLSGILSTSDGPRYISIISYQEDNPHKIIQLLLLKIFNSSPCPS